MMNNGHDVPWQQESYYDRTYYDHYNEQGAYVAETWGPLFRHIATRIVEEQQPQTVIEFGCAKGFLVQALRDAGVDAWGLDWSTYAIAAADPGVQPYCAVADVRTAAIGRFDVAICMEVVEHLDPADAPLAIANIAASANTVYFSSNPDRDFPEESHVNVQEPPYWERLFNRCGMVRAPGTQPDYIAPWALRFERKAVDIVLPVFNSPQHLRRCVESLYRTADENAFHLILVDDGSDRFTRALIDDLRATRGNVVVVRNDTNQGYLAAANRGLRESRANRIILLNSDTILTPGWLQRLLDAAASDVAVGLVCPLSNRAENLSLPMPVGHNLFDAAELIASVPPRYAEAATVVGFCLLLTRQLFAAIGGFDPIYSPGYVEEADYQFRAEAAGFRAVVAENVYIYHARSASFGKVTEHFRTNYPLFVERWAEQHAAAVAGFDETDPLGDARAALLLASAIPPDIVYDIVYYLPMALRGIGGMISIVELANRLVLRGHRVTIAHLGSWASDVECLFTPISYATEATFLAAPPRTRVLVATAYQTVKAVSQVCGAYGIAAAYFIQDYEGYFDNARDLTMAAETYEQIPTRITVSHWLADLLREQHGLTSTIIPLGVATDEYYPGEETPPAQIAAARASGKTTVFGVLRRDERRGAPYLIELVRRARAYPDLHFFFAGEEIPILAENVTALGSLDRAQMAKFLRSCDIVVESSLYHGFGMLAIEAMASGTVVVLTDSGGCNDYARSGDNCLMTPPRDVRAMLDAVVRLHGDPALRHSLGKAGRATAERFDWNTLAEQHAALLLPLGESGPLDTRRYARLPERGACIAATDATDVADLPPEPPTTLVYQFFDGHNHLYSADPHERCGGSYRNEGIAFALWVEPFDLAVPLYRFYQPISGHHFLGQESAAAVGCTREGMLGYVATEPIAAARPLYRARNGTTGDWLCVLDPIASVPPGYRVEELIGYIPTDRAPTTEERLLWLEAHVAARRGRPAVALGRRTRQFACQFGRLISGRSNR